MWYRHHTIQPGHHIVMIKIKTKKRRNKCVQANDRVIIKGMSPDFSNTDRRL